VFKLKTAKCPKKSGQKNAEKRIFVGEEEKKHQKTIPGRRTPLDHAATGVGGGTRKEEKKEKGAPGKRVMSSDKKGSSF